MVTRDILLVGLDNRAMFRLTAGSNSEDRSVLVQDPGYLVFCCNYWTEKVSSQVLNSLLH
jgi:hypothetical protein